MKKYVVMMLLLVCGLTFAQEKNVKHEVVGQLVKSTYYDENGNIRQEGFYKDGKLHGQWISYDANGKKIAMGQYENGKKIGKWFFWNTASLNEVDFKESQIAQVKKWSSEAIVKN